LFLEALDSLQYYTSGVYFDRGCAMMQKDNLDHAVVVVGYGTDPTKGDYWIIRNSWGLSNQSTSIKLDFKLF
jgi:cathepsin L